MNHAKLGRITLRIIVEEKIFVACLCEVIYRIFVVMHFENKFAMGSFINIDNFLLPRLRPMREFVHPCIAQAYAHSTHWLMAG
jgi:hypothetical protein